MVRREYESEIFEQCFDALWPLTEGRRIFKTRHRIPYGAHTIELDVFGGHLAGLIVAEIEFSAVEVAESFMPPSWLGQEVTNDLRYRNHALAEAQSMPEPKMQKKNIS